MFRSHVVRRRLANVGAVAILLPIAGCSASGDGDSPSPPAASLSCPSPGAPVTLAVGARANSSVPALPASIRTLVEGAAAQSATITVLRIDGKPSTAFEGIFHYTANNGPARKRELDTFLKTTFDAVGNVRAKEPEVDLLLTLNEAARLTPGGGTIVVVDSGIQTAGAIRFQDEGTFTADPDETADYLEKNGQLPDLSGRAVVLAGLGNTADPQPKLTNPDLRRRITALWLTIAERSGACVDIVETAEVRKAVETNQPVTVVQPPGPPTFEPCGTTILREDTVGFLPDQAVFRSPDEVRAVLRNLAEQIKGGDLRVKLTGTTSSAGNNEAGRVALSRDRANAVRDVLMQLGAPGEWITTVGAGSHGPRQVQDRDARGILIPSKAALNRSVVIELSCPS